MVHVVLLIMRCVRCIAFSMFRVLQLIQCIAIIQCMRSVTPMHCVLISRLMSYACYVEYVRCAFCLTDIAFHVV